MVFLTALLAGAAVVLALPVVSDVLSLLVAARRRPRAYAVSTELPRLVFLVPAHDEELLIGACVRSLLALGYPADRFDVVVVADNCTDRTAECARAAGASCLERADAARPGKPRAIAWALSHLALENRNAVVVIDADTTVDPHFAAALAQAGPLDGKVLQAYFDVANPEDSPLTRMAAVLAAANFRFAYDLKRRAGVNVPMLGNGMCIGARVLATYGWRAFTIAEDWELYADYTALGVSIESVPEARLLSQEARSLRESSTQRQRWTAGKLTVLMRKVVPIVRSPKIGLRQKIDAAAELSAPGPVVHLGIVTAGTLLAGGLGSPGARWVVAALWIPIVRQAIYAVSGLLAQPDPFDAAGAFVFLPAYAVWRAVTAVLSLKMVGAERWIRTARR